MADSTYIPKTYDKQGGLARVIADGGKIEGESGGIFDAQSGFKFWLDSSDNEFTAAQLAGIINGNINNTVIANSAGVLSTPQLPSAHGYIILSLADAASNASAVMASGKAGEVLTIIGRGGGSAASVYIAFSGGTGGLSGVSVIGTLSGSLSSIKMHLSAASQPYLKLACFDDGTWAVIDRSNTAIVIEQGAA